MNTPWIAPSILSANFARLGEEVDAVLAAGADIVHFDVMDNHYVPNLTIGPLVCEALRKHGVKAPIDVHLMVRPVDRIIPDFAKAGATYHQLPSRGQRARRSHHRADPRAGLPGRAGVQSGHAARLPRPHAATQLDLVLIMSVNPGFGGQKFIPGALDKIARSAAAHRRQRPRGAARSRRRREGRQHRRDRARRRRHLRGGLGDLRRAGLRAP